MPYDLYDGGDALVYSGVGTLSWPEKAGEPYVLTDRGVTVVDGSYNAVLGDGGGRWVALSPTAH